MNEASQNKPLSRTAQQTTMPLPHPCIRGVSCIYCTKRLLLHKIVLEFRYLNLNATFSADSARFYLLDQDSAAHCWSNRNSISTNYWRFHLAGISFQFLITVEKCTVQPLNTITREMSQLAATRELTLTTTTTNPGHVSWVIRKRLQHFIVHLYQGDSERL